MTTAQPFLGSVDVVLATGAVATIRPIEPEDRDALRALYARCDPDSLRLRFFSYSPRAADTDVNRMIRPRSVDHIAVVATARGEAIGMGCVERIKRSDVGDIALLVDDARHGEGVGMLLIEHLVDAARRAGYRKIRADVLAENTRMLRVFRDLGAEIRSHLDYGVVDIEVPLTDRAEWRQAIDRRESIADHASIARVLAPHSVVVIGVSTRPTSIGHRILNSIIDSGYTGDVYAVNRRGGSVGGTPAWTSIDQLPVVPDLAIVATPAPQVPTVIDDCARAGVRGAVIISDGFAELGPLGAATQRSILAAARSAGMRLIGPNCLGIANTDPTVSLNATFADLVPRPGTVGVASQSGGVGLAVLDYLGRHGIGVSTFVSLGNKADVSGNDLLLFWEQDPSTQVCLLYLESFGNARRFARIAARVSRTKPIVAITAGRSQAGARGVRSHTAAAATPAVALDALFAKSGVISAASMSEAMDVTGLLTRSPLPAGRRVAVVTNGGGPGALAADACAAVDLELPELSSAVRTKLERVLPAHASIANPVDTTAGGTAQVLAAASEILLECDDIDTVMVVHTSLTGEDTADLADALDRVAAGHGDTPLIAVYIGKSDMVVRDSSCPVFDFPEPAARALAAVTSYAKWRSTPAAAEPRLAGIQRRAAKRQVEDQLRANPGGTWLDTDAAATLVAAYGVPVVPTTRADTADQAVAAAQAAGFPVAVKAADGTILHRTDIDAVRLNIDSEAGVRDAVTAIRTACGQRCPVVVQPMAAPGVETAVGVVDDRAVGPIVMVALGGVATDLLADRSFRLAPVSRRDARDQIRSLRSAPLLFGYRGSPPVDVKALEDVVMRIGRLASDIPEIVDLDLNPVIVSADGAVAVDVKVRVAPAPHLDLAHRTLSDAAKQ